MRRHRLIILSSLSFFVAVATLCLLEPAAWAQSSSNNYQLKEDFIGTGGLNDSTSSSYRAQDSIGDIGTGDSIASKGTADQFRRFTVSYIANITTATEPGTYQTTLTYICTATF